MATDAGLASATGTNAAPPTEAGIAADLAKRYVEIFARNWQLTEEITAKGHLRERLETLAADRDSLAIFVTALQQTDSLLKTDLTGAVCTANQTAVNDLQQSALAISGRQASLCEHWIQVRSALEQRSGDLAQALAERHVAGQLAFLLSVNNRWFWLSGLLSVVMLLALSAHDRRHEIRRHLHGGKARSMGAARVLVALSLVLASVTVALFAFGDRAYNFLISRAGAGPGFAQDAERDLAAQAAETPGLEQQRRAADERLAAAEQSLKQALGTVDRRWCQQILTCCRRSQELDTALLVQGKLAGGLKADLDKLAAVETNLAATAIATAARHRDRQWICAGLGLALLSANISAGWLFQRGVRQRRQRVLNTCPLCLGVGTFAGPGEVQGPQGPLAPDMIMCQNVVSEYPREECEFVFSAMYRDVIKLCFPTLGIPSAGKTHWLGMVYRQLNRGNYPDFVQFERIKSQSSDQFDIVVDELLNRKIGPAATQTHRIPHPLIFNFIDRDRWGVSNTLVNIFDYSGEVLRSQTLEDRQRQRALDADGFLFFLDPTQPSEMQSEALAGFREDVRRIKGVRAGRQIATPVALCVPKIDLMISEPYAGSSAGGVIDAFYRDLAEIGWETRLATIKARSRLMARLRDTIWPGWQIERQIDDLFGGRFTFFPLTPVGLDGAGERDLTRRTIAPLGLLDPLLWLLHMNGYPVLPK